MPGIGAVWSGIGHHLGHGFGRHQHTRYTGTRMGACTDHVKIFDLFAAVVRPEPGALQLVGLEAKRSAFVRPEIVFEILRCHEFAGDDVLAQIGHHGAFQVILNFHPENKILEPLEIL
jgi:hypothetical protein